MHVTGDVVQVRAARWSDGLSTWGLVPTMGYLHEGHLSLVRRARIENDRVAVSIFVNPTQFAPNEDLDVYPRDLARDFRLLEPEGVDLVFVPDVGTMYPPGFQTYVTVEEVTRPLEGRVRPVHFRGVTTVVAKLFHIVQPTRAYFGQKDGQQAVVIRQMVRDLDFNLDIVICPTVREIDGLAMSSRNSHLSPEERQAATVLFRALQAARAAHQGGERDARALRQWMEETVAAEPLAQLDYASVSDPDTLVELETAKTGALLSLAVFVGRTRLIDNLRLAD